MSRERFDKVISKWKSNDVLFVEHASATAVVLSEKIESVGLHGVMWVDGGQRTLKTAMSRTLLSTNREKICLLARTEPDEVKYLWAGCYKPVHIYPNQAEVVLIPTEVIQAIANESYSIRKEIMWNFSYLQEDDSAIKVVETLRLIDEQMTAFWVGAFEPETLMENSKNLRQLVKKISQDTSFEWVLRKSLEGQRQQSAITTICEGIRFLHTFR